MKAYLNNILLDWVQVGEKSFPSDVTTHAIDDNSSDSIASHINKDDFELLTILKDIDGVSIAHNSVNWKIWYFVSINKVYEASHINGVFTNCSVTIDNKVKIPISGFDWGQKGILMKRASVS